MLSHNRPGLTRGKIVFFIALGAAALLIAAAIIESLSYVRLLKEGAVDTLESLNFNDRFSASKKPESKANSVAVFESKDSPFTGNENAPIQVVEFVDFSCPFSKDESSIIRGLATSHPDMIRLMVRNFPIDDIHPNARRAASAAVCANAQGKYWAMHDAIFANQSADGSFKDADLRRYALGAGVDGAKYDTCMKSSTTAAAVEADAAAGSAAGVTGTPTFFVNGYKIDGAIPSDIWQKILKLYK
jgi:protein-disulfide isomerase